MPRWIQDNDERMRQVDSSADPHCTHGVELETACDDCAEDADYAGENDDELMAALVARKNGDSQKLVEYKAKMKGVRHARTR